MKIGRNDPCPCGSGKKYKKCCYLNSPIDNLMFQYPENPNPAETKEDDEDDYDISDVIDDLHAEPELTMQFITNLRMGFMGRKPHIKEYIKIRKMHQEICNAMGNYYHSGKFKIMINTEHISHIERSKNTFLVESNFDLEVKTDSQAFFDFIIYKSSPINNCITEDFISNRRYKKPEKIELLQSMLKSKLGLFEVTQTEMMEGYADLKDVFTGAEHKIIDIGLSGQQSFNDYFLYTRIITHRGISYGSGLNIIYKKTDKFIKNFIKDNKKDFNPEHEFKRFIEIYNHYSQYKNRMETHSTFEA